MAQWNRNESLEINPYVCGQLVFDKGCQDHPIEKEANHNRYYMISLIGKSRIENLKTDWEYLGLGWGKQGLR